MPTAQTVNDEEGDGAQPRFGLGPRPIKKLCIILLSFLPAVALVSITNVVLAHLLLAFGVLFPPKPNAAASPKAITRTVYVPPTEEDLERLRQELERSEPLPPIAAGEDAQRSVARVQSVLASTGALLKEREQTLDAAKDDIDELSEAFASFEERLEQDTKRGAPPSEDTAMVLEQHVPNLTAILGRSTLMDMERDDLVDTFMLAMEEVQMLLSGDLSADAQKRALFVNANNTLLASLTGNEAGEAGAVKSTCQSYLTLDQGSKPAAELQTAATMRRYADGVCSDTGRESDLYELVENIKHILSRRDLASVSSEENGYIPNPIEEEGVEAIRAQISPMVDTMQKRWKGALAQERQMGEYWVGRTKTLAASSGSGGEGGMCASPELVEDMVASGLKAFRMKADLRSALVNSVTGSLADAPDMAQLLSEEMEKVPIPEINYQSDNRNASPRGSSSWRVGRKSVSYMVDGPLLQRGVAGWIDSFVDAISGYNDNLDALIDWAVGDDGDSVGTSVVGAISRTVRKIPFPAAYLPQLKKSGILAGRTRAVFNE